MLKKVKYLLVCAVVTVGISSCSKSDDSGTGGSEEFAISVSVTSGSTIEQTLISVANPDGSDLVTDLQTRLGGENWTKKVKKKNNKQVANVIAQGFGLDSDAIMTVTVKNGNKVVKEGTSKGDLLSVSLSF